MLAVGHGGCSSYERRNPGAILHRRIDPVGKRSAGVRPAAGAHAVVGAMLGDNERARFVQIEHLPGPWPLLMAGSSPRRRPCRKAESDR
jgi:hypothetical protein